MVDETCQSTGLIYAGSSYNSSYGSAVVQIVEISPTGAHDQLCNITTPWGSTHNSEILEYEVLKTYSRSITGGTEYYTLYCTFVVYSESAGAIYTECWYTDLGNRYVKTTGSDSALGTTWGVAWKTVGYGFQNIPSGKDLYVEEGLYSSETYSNIDPPQTTSMYIQPVGHTEAACEVHVYDGVPPTITGGLVCADNAPDEAILSPIYTFIMTGHAVDLDGYITDWCVRQGSVGNSDSIKLKVFRDNGTEYIFIGETDAISSSVASTATGSCVIHVQSGDLLAIKCTVGIGCGIYTDGASTLKGLLGDITSDTNKSSWFTSGTDAFVVHGYHTA